MYYANYPDWTQEALIYIGICSIIYGILVISYFASKYLDEFFSKRTILLLKQFEVSYEVKLQNYKKDYQAFHEYKLEEFKKDHVNECPKCGTTELLCGFGRDEGCTSHIGEI